MCQYGNRFNAFLFYPTGQNNCLISLQEVPPSHIICVDESNEALGEGEGVADEGGELAVVRLARQDVEVLPQLAPPSLAH